MFCSEPLIELETNEFNFVNHNTTDEGNKKLNERG